jgi:hypothetical protein
MRLRILKLRSPYRRFLLGLGLGVLASAVVALVTSLGYFSGYQGIALDLFFWAQGRARPRSSSWASTTWRFSG